MRRHWIWPVLLVLVMGLTACQVEITPTPKPDDSSKASDPAPVPPPPDSGTADPNNGNAAKPGLSGGIADSTTPVQTDEPAEPTVPDGSDEEPSRVSQDYTMEGYRWYLEGEWIGVEGEIEGDRYNLADSHAALELTFLSCDGVTEDGHGEWGMAARYDYTYNYDDHETLDNLYLPSPLLDRNVKSPCSSKETVVSRPNGFLLETCVSIVPSCKERTFFTISTASE